MRAVLATLISSTSLSKLPIKESKWTKFLFIFDKDVSFGLAICLAFDF